jgi:hypothetical protein
MIKPLAKQCKAYFPLELRRILSVTLKDTNVILQACIGRKDGKSGGEVKKIALEFQEKTLASSWSIELKELVFGGNY